jgi:hypothetical protein
MPHTGVEAKLPWRLLPAELRTAIAAQLGASVQRAARVWGGYAPTPTFRLRLADGHSAFVKLTGPEENQFSQQALRRERRIYRELGAVLAGWAPDCYGELELGDWQGLLLEDLGPKSVPPWTPAVARGVSADLADYHAAVRGATLPAWVPGPGRYLRNFASAWARLRDGDELTELAGLAGPRSGEGVAWLAAHAALLDRAAQALGDDEAPCFLHGDVRSDNLRWNGRLRIFDWPHAGLGPPEFDLAAFAQTVTVEGGPSPEQLVAWYAERGSVREDALTSAVAAVAGFFADAAWREPVPGLPRLRPFQQAQLRVTLAWAARRLDLPPPMWMAALPA